MRFLVDMSDCAYVMEKGWGSCSSLLFRSRGTGVGTIKQGRGSGVQKNVS